MNAKVVLFYCVDHVKCLVFRHQHAFISNLTAHFGIERSLIEDNLEMFLAFSNYLSEFQYLSLALHLGVTDESGRFVFVNQLDPVARHLFGCLA